MTKPAVCSSLCLTLLLAASTVALAQMPSGAGQSAGDQWDKRFSVDRYLYGTEPVEFLRDNIDRLPKGKALCLAAVTS